MYVFRDFYREDLVRVAATITDFLERKRFTSTIVDNTNYQRQVGGRTVTKLYEPDLGETVAYATAAGIACAEVES